MQTEIIIAGFGGQGVLFAGQLRLVRVRVGVWIGGAGIFIGIKLRLLRRFRLRMAHVGQEIQADGHRRILPRRRRRIFFLRPVPPRGPVRSTGSSSPRSSRTESGQSS